MKMLPLFVLALFFVTCAKTTEEPEPEVPKVSILAVEIDEGNEDKVFYIQMRLSASSSDVVTAYIKTYDGSAEANKDYLPLDMEPVVFSPGTTTSEFKINLLGDEEFEGDEEFTVRIESAEGAAIGTAEATIVLLDDEENLLEIPTIGYTTPESYAGWNLIWQDEFEGDAVNTNNWTFEIGNGQDGWGNNESQYYRQENTFIQDENLVIEAQKENYGGFPYTSTRMITHNKFDFQYGRVDIRAVLPYGQGIWPALWMLGSNFTTVTWPACGEIDIVELIGHQPSTVHGTAHWSLNGSHAQNGDHTNLSSGIFNDEFHVFSIIWDEEKITWLLDDQQYHSLNITSPGVSEFHENFFFIFNVAVGGNWPGYPDASTQFPQYMIVDYIRVFQEE